MADINIYGKLKNVTDGKLVDSELVYDPDLGKTQAEINKDKIALSDLKEMRLEDNSDTYKKAINFSFKGKNPVREWIQYSTPEYAAKIGLNIGGIKQSNSSNANHSTNGFRDPEIVLQSTYSVDGKQYQGCVSPRHVIIGQQFDAKDKDNLLNDPFTAKTKSSSYGTVPYTVMNTTGIYRVTGVTTTDTVIWESNIKEKMAGVLSDQKIEKPSTITGKFAGKSLTIGKCKFVNLNADTTKELEYEIDANEQIDYSDTNLSYKLIPSEVTEVDLTNFDCSKMTSLLCLFNDKETLTSIIGLENLDISNVTDIRWMFLKTALNIETLNLSKWDLSNCSEILGIFNLCRKQSPVNIDLSGWDVRKVTNFTDLCRACKDLEYLSCANWKLPNSLANVNISTSIFSDNPALKTLDLSGWDLSGVEINSDSHSPFIDGDDALETIIVKDCPEETINKIIQLAKLSGQGDWELVDNELKRKA